MSSDTNTPFVPPMHLVHGRGVRGLTLSRSSRLFGGNFGRIFRALPPAEFGDNDKESEANLIELGKSMVGDGPGGEPEEPKDGADSEESGIPALYTYLGQFVDHDLTFDPASSLQQQNDPDSLVDFRTPRFDLDSVYGRGPDDQPYIYDFSLGPKRVKFLLGKRLAGGGRLNANARDLPRNTANLPVGAPLPARAIIGDPRNDENVVVSQLHGLFLRFHNRFVDEHNTLDFAAVQREVRYHYQWMLIHNFLPTLIREDVLFKVFPHLNPCTNRSLVDNPPKLRFYHARDEAFMPLEFSAAAYRFGHSMVRPGYRLNDGTPNDPATDTLLPIFPPFDNPNARSLRGFCEPEDGFAIDWARFIDIEDRPCVEERPEDEAPTADDRRRLQLAYRIDTSIVDPLGSLPDDVAGPPIQSLAQRNLLRGWRMRLPSGQAIARAMGEKPLERVRIGKFEEGADDLLLIETISPVFKDNCPLWTYVLAETFHNNHEGKCKVNSKLLGPVGGTLVAETFAGLLINDSHSFLSQDPNWKPQIGGVHFGLKEFVMYALGLD